MLPCVMRLLVPGSAWRKLKHRAVASRRLAVTAVMKATKLVNAVAGVASPADAIRGRFHGDESGCPVIIGLTGPEALPQP